MISHWQVATYSREHCARLKDKMITIEQLKLLNKLEKIAVTEHARIRLHERGISIDDIINVITALSYFLLFFIIFN